MTNHEPLNQRIRQILAKREKVSERKMFGGACFMINGNMDWWCSQWKTTNHEWTRMNTKKLSLMSC